MKGTPAEEGPVSLVARSGGVAVIALTEAENGILETIIPFRPIQREAVTRGAEGASGRRESISFSVLWAAPAAVRQVVDSTESDRTAPDAVARAETT